MTDKDIVMSRLFYPAWWLKISGYFDSKINTGPGVIMFAPSPFSTGGKSGSLLVIMVTAIVSSTISFIVTYIMMNKSKKIEWNQSGYGASPVHEREETPVIQSVRTPFAIAPGRKSTSDYIVIGV